MEDGFPSDADVRARATATTRERDSLDASAEDGRDDDDADDFLLCVRGRATDATRLVFDSTRVGRGAGVGDGLAGISSEIIGE